MSSIPEKEGLAPAYKIEKPTVFLPKYSWSEQRVRDVLKAISESLNVDDATPDHPRT